MNFFKINAETMELTAFAKFIPFIYMIVVLSLLYINRNKIKSWKHEKKLVLFIVFSSIAFELIYYYQKALSVGSIHAYFFELDMLPLHLCTLSLWLSIFAILKKNEKAFKFTFFAANMGVILAMIFPALNYSFDNFRYYHYYYVHIGFLIMNYYMYFIYNFKVEFKDSLKAAATLIIFGLTVVLPINYFLGSFYMFIYNTSSTPFSIFPSPWIALIVKFFLVITVFLLIYGTTLIPNIIREHILNSKKIKQLEKAPATN